MKNETLSLLDKIKTGDESAFDILAKEYEGLTEAAVKRFLPSFDIRNGENPVFGEEDLRQCAALALFKAAQTYDEGKEVSFGLYAKICVNNALISTLRKYKTEQKRQRRAKERENKAPADPIAALINAEDDERLKAKIKTELSDFEKSVFDLYINDKSTREIAEILGREEKSVSNALYRMKVKIKGLVKN